MAIRPIPRISRVGFAIGVIGATTAILFSGTSVASADTKPAAGVPATVSADPLPTVQINGVVWAQVMVGNIVYATGDFTSARPAGAKAGTSETPRKNLVAYDVTTGVMTSFTHTLDQQGRAITASPDGHYLYVGGSFTTVDGQAHSRVAQFDLTNGGALVSSFKGGTSSDVLALTATNDKIFIGGSFARAVDGSGHSQLVGYTSGGQILDWKPQVTGNNGISAMVISPNGNNVIIGGNFTRINDKRFHALGAVSIASGKPTAFASSASSFAIKSDVKSAGITSLSTDGTNVYLTSYNYTARDRKGGFEGRAAINPTSGKIVFINDCHGDSYSAIPIGKVLYSVSHAHDCQPMDYFPEGGTAHRALAETTTKSGTNNAPKTKYSSFKGTPHSKQLAWYPTLTSGVFTGQSQAAWSVTGNANYLALGGEFLATNGRSQQGLVRYAISSKAPNTVGPTEYATSGIKAGKVSSSGSSKVTYKTTWDQDNAVLTYKIYRDDQTTPIYTKSRNTRFWNVKNFSITDTKLKAGSTHKYTLVVSDPFGNSVTTTN